MPAEQVQSTTWAVLSTGNLCSAVAAWAWIDPRGARPTKL